MYRYIKINAKLVEKPETHYSELVLHLKEVKHVSKTSS